MEINILHRKTGIGGGTVLNYSNLPSFRCEREVFNWEVLEQVADVLSLEAFKARLDEAPVNLI